MCSTVYYLLTLNELRWVGFPSSWTFCRLNFRPAIITVINDMSERLLCVATIYDRHWRHLDWAMVGRHTCLFADWGTPHDKHLLPILCSCCCSDDAVASRYVYGWHHFQLNDSILWRCTPHSISIHTTISAQGIKYWRLKPTVIFVKFDILVVDPRKENKK